MKKHLLIAAAVLLAPLVSSGPAFAADIPTLSGGVGQDEQARIEAAQSQYSLKVIFSADGGEFLSDVQYSVTDASGANVTTGVAKGPYLLLGLPEGTYTVHAMFDMQHQSQKVSLGKALKTVQFRFKGVAQ